MIRGVVVIHEDGDFVLTANNVIQVLRCLSSKNIEDRLVFIAAHHKDMSKNFLMRDTLYSESYVSICCYRQY